MMMVQAHGRVKDEQPTCGKTALAVSGRIVGPHSDKQDFLGLGPNNLRLFRPVGLPTEPYSGDWNYPCIAPDAGVKEN
jgi:hypothetical protein